MQVRLFLFLGWEWRRLDRGRRDGDIGWKRCCFSVRAFVLNYGVML